MRLLSAFVLSILPFSALAGNALKGRRHSKIGQNLRSRNNNGTIYTVKDFYASHCFLDQWNFHVGADPTHGNVNFLSKEEAIAKKLATVQPDGTVVLAVDDYSSIPEGGKRNSVRIQTKKSYNHGLFIADFLAMPHGCSVWPAYWSLGPTWPDAGEIDILEGVHEQPVNQYTLHSSASAGCTLSTDGMDIMTSVIHDICDSTPEDNRGCGFLDSDTRSYGKGFNAAGGGVLAHLWDDNGIKMWHFAREMVPADITAKTPNPASWGKPVAFWSSKTCDIASHFYNHTLVLDTTICGDWAGPSYANSGCPGTCAQAVANATNYQNAKWKINYIAVYE